MLLPDMNGGNERRYVVLYLEGFYSVLIDISLAL
jgi:hypothetical protein